VSEESLYAVLGVSETASPEEIQTAYRRLVRQTHPDAGGNGYLFRRVQDAYDVLSDSGTRAAYDQTRIWNQHGPTSSQAGPQQSWRDPTHSARPSPVGVTVANHPWLVLLAGAVLFARVDPVMSGLAFVGALLAVVGSRRATRRYERRHAGSGGELRPHTATSAAGLLCTEIIMGLSILFVVAALVAFFGSHRRRRRARWS
jgi:curved DNA-binding protein CbpA